MKHLFTLLLVAGGLQAQTVTIPPEVKTEPGRLAALSLSHDGDDVRWVVSPEVDLFREYDPDPKLYRLRFIAYSPGVYQFQAIACKGAKLGNFATTKIVVGSEPPKPPTPPPTPTDPLFLKLKPVFDAEKSANKVAEAKSLAGVYRKSVDLLPAVVTAGSLYEGMVKVRKEALPDESLNGIRKTLSEELKAILPDDADVVLTQDQKDKAKVLFLAVASALEALK